MGGYQYNGSTTKESWEYRPLPPNSKTTHGTTTMYAGYGCRCDDCRAAWRVYMRAYMARKRAKADK